MTFRFFCTGSPIPVEGDEHPEVDLCRLSSLRQAERGHLGEVLVDRDLREELRESLAEPRSGLCVLHELCRVAKVCQDLRPRAWSRRP